MYRTVLIIFLLQSLSYGAGTGEEEQSWSLMNSWTSYTNYGQISAVSVDTSGNVYVFHRADHVWDFNTFYNDVYRYKNLGPIRDETVIVLDSVTGSVKKKTGARIFYIPHGLTVDHMNNIWITDVALHQVFKFPSLNLSSSISGLEHPEILLGTQFEPGNGPNHFCKPTDVAVDSSTEEFYVADGYCNSRIIKYDKTGKQLLSWGRDLSGHGPLDGYTLRVPHAMAVSVDEKLLFVADRENFRALVYEIPKQKFREAFPEHKRIFSVAYSSIGGKHLFMLSNASFQSPGIVTVYNLRTKGVVTTFSPPGGFSNPHDLAISPDGKYCYVVELSPTKVWKFKLESSSSSERELTSVVAMDNLKMSDSQNVLVSKVDHEAEDKATHDFLGGTLLAIGVVSFVIIIIFVIFVFHMYKKKARYSQYEMRRLILDDEEDIGINTS